MIGKSNDPESFQRHEEKKTYNGLVILRKINKRIEIKEREHDQLRFEFLKLVK